jgi:uncharacterized protein
MKRIGLVSPPLSGHALTVDLAKIPAYGLTLETEIGPAALALPEDEQLLITVPVQVQGRLTKVMEQVFFHGSIGGVIVAPCSRCLEAVNDGFAVEVRGVFLPVGSHRISDEGGEGGATDDLDVYSHDGLRINLYPLVRDQVVMAFPVQTLCREDCAGLCQACGANLNEEPCACQSESGEPRFAVLKQLKSSGPT